MIQDQSDKSLPKRCFMALKILFMGGIYLIPMLSLVYLGGKFGIFDLSLIWLFLMLFFAVILIFGVVLRNTIRCYQIIDNQLVIKYYLNLVPQKIPLNTIVGIDISISKDGNSVSIESVNKSKIKIYTFEVDDYMTIRNWALAHKIPLSINYFLENFLRIIANSFPHIWWFKKEFMIQRTQDLPITKAELLGFHNPKFSIQFLGTSEDYFRDDGSVVDTFRLQLSDSKQFIDINLEEGYILATTYQNKFKKALQELEFQLNAKIS